MRTRQGPSSFHKPLSRYLHHWVQGPSCSGITSVSLLLHFLRLIFPLFPHSFIEHHFRKWFRLASTNSQSQLSPSHCLTQCTCGDVSSRIADSVTTRSGRSRQGSSSHPSSNPSPDRTSCACPIPVLQVALSISRSPMSACFPPATQENNLKIFSRSSSPRWYTAPASAESTCASFSSDSIAFEFKIPACPPHNTRSR